jgi:hypothetical protein
LENEPLRAIELRSRATTRPKLATALGFRREGDGDGDGAGEAEAEPVSDEDESGFEGDEDEFEGEGDESDGEVEQLRTERRLFLLGVEIRYRHDRLALTLHVRAPDGSDVEADYRALLRDLDIRAPTPVPVESPTAPLQIVADHPEQTVDATVVLSGARVVAVGVRLLARLLLGVGRPSHDAPAHGDRRVGGAAGGDGAPARSAARSHCLAGAAQRAVGRPHAAPEQARRRATVK